MNLQSKTDEELNVSRSQLLRVLLDREDLLNQKLAVLIGWKRIEPKRIDYLMYPAYPCSGIAEWLSPNGQECLSDWIPKFTTSLNEVAKVEAGLTFSQYQLFQKSIAEAWTEERLKGVANCPRAPLSATARQRTIALISVLQP